MRRDRGKQQGIDLLGQTQAAAERNNVIHGFLIQKDGRMNLVTRDVKNGKYLVKSKPHDSTAHMEQFMNAMIRLQAWSGITDEEIDQYGRLVEADAEGFPNQDNSRPESPASSEQPDLEPSSILPQLGE